MKAQSISILVIKPIFRLYQVAYSKRSDTSYHNIAGLRNTVTGSVLLIHFFRNEKLIIDKPLLRQLYNLPGSVEWNP